MQVLQLYEARRLKTGSHGAKLNDTAALFIENQQGSLNHALVQNSIFIKTP